MGRKPKLTKEQISEAVKMVRGGLSYAEVGRRFGLKAGSISWHCKKQGVATKVKSGRQPKTHNQKKVKSDK